MPIESVMPSSHLILCRPLLPLPLIPPSIRVFSSESTLQGGGNWHERKETPGPSWGAGSLILLEWVGGDGFIVVIANSSSTHHMERPHICSVCSVVLSPLHVCILTYPVFMTNL